MTMFAVMGVTGNVGGEMARTLLAAKKSVRAIVRDAKKGEEWARLGCEIAIADLNDVKSLTAAFQGVDGVFTMLPPIYDPAPGFAEHMAMSKILTEALKSACPKKVVHLSTIGAQATEQNLLSLHTILEKMLGEVSLPIAILRPGWFMENSAQNVTSARDQGVIYSFLAPAEKGFPFIATAEIGQIGAELLQETWTGHRVVELTGPRPVSPNDLAAGFAKVLGRPIAVKIIPREEWEALSRSQGMKNPTPWMRMLDGFNEGWIGFERPAEVRKGKGELETVLKGLVEQAAG
jgi:NAD(P)H dehydrogenase (quinone)